MEIMVSVICNTYNHEAYIRDALDGFVMQETTFPFEVLIHDDASTDATARIIREYAEKYPDLIKPILQTENQYSKQVGIFRTFQQPRITGKYFAFCEGDDYWTDPHKLQKQVDAMEQHPELDISAHRMMILRDGKIVAPGQKETQNRIFSAEEVIRGGGSFVSTASLMLRTELLDRECAFAKEMALDYIWQVSGALRGGMLYLGDCMGVYRMQVKGSWTARMKNDVAARNDHSLRMKKILQMMNEETGYRYAEAINENIALSDLNIMIRQGQWRQLLQTDGRKLLRYLPVRKRPVAVLKAVRRSMINAAAGSK